MKIEIEMNEVEMSDINGRIDIIPRKIKRIEIFENDGSIMFSIKNPEECESRIWAIIQ